MPGAPAISLFGKSLPSHHLTQKHRL